MPANETKTLRGAKMIAAYSEKDPKLWRRVLEQMKNGRFPHWREGRTYCADPDTIDRWKKAQQQLAIEGRDPTPQAIWALMEQYAREAKAEHDDDDQAGDSRIIARIA